MGARVSGWVAGGVDLVRTPEKGGASQKNEKSAGYAAGYAAGFTAGYTAGIKMRVTTR